MKFEYTKNELEFIEERRKDLEKYNGHFNVKDHLITPVLGAEVGKEVHITFKIADPALAHFFATSLLYGYDDGDKRNISLQEKLGISDVSVYCTSNKQIVIDKLKSVIETIEREGI